MNFLEHLEDRSFGIGMQADGKYYYVDMENEVVTFPIWNLSGQMLGYQEYKWLKPKTHGNCPRDQKYYTYLPKQVLGVYGLDQLPENYLGTIYLVEGAWEVIYGGVFGLPCVAVLGNNPKQLKNWITSIPNRVVSLCQPDSAGKKLANLSKQPPIYLDGDLDDCLRNGGWWGVPNELVLDGG